MCDQCKQLTHLYITGVNWLTAVTYERLAQLTKLVTLNVSRTDINDICIEALSTSESLEVIA